jgi:hypothetical protein
MQLVAKCPYTDYGLSWARASTELRSLASCFSISRFVQIWPNPQYALMTCMISTI